MSPARKFTNSFVNAYKGIIIAFEGRNMKIHGAMTLAVLLLACFLPLTLTEWFVVLILIGLVWSAEIFNTSIEYLANVLRDTNKLSYAATREVRDLAAGAVLVIALIAALVGLLIFLPKLV